jgi:hypothetical protein
MYAGIQVPLGAKPAVMKRIIGKVDGLSDRPIRSGSRRKWNDRPTNILLPAIALHL